MLLIDLAARRFGQGVSKFEIFRNHKNADGVIHLAAHKAVKESVKQPLKYYHNNINSLVVLISKMVEHRIKNLVFSSSCTVYGQPELLPVTEDAPLKQAESPYGNTKKICEDILRDTSSANKQVGYRYD